jgi:hypothetical protein
MHSSLYTDWLHLKSIQECNTILELLLLLLPAGLISSQLVQQTIVCSCC